MTLAYRICPGMHFALDNLFINVASTLHVFDISAPRDKDGMPMKMSYDNTDGLVSYVEVICYMDETYLTHEHDQLSGRLHIHDQTAFKGGGVVDPPVYLASELVRC